MTWPFWISLAIACTSAEQVVNRFTLADTNRYWEYLVGYNLGAILIVVALFPVTTISMPVETAIVLGVSGVIWFLSAMFSFKAHQAAEVGLTTVLNQVQLVAVFIGGILVFGEPTSWQQILGVALIVLGIGNLQKVGSFKSAGVSYKLISVLLLSIALLMDKYLSQIIEPSVIVLFGFSIPLAAAMVSRPHRLQEASRFTRSIAYRNLIAGALSGLAYYSLVKSMSSAPISLVVPLYNLHVVLVMALGYLVLHERKHFARRFAAAILVLSGAVVMQW